MIAKHDTPTARIVRLPRLLAMCAMAALLGLLVVAGMAGNADATVGPYDPDRITWGDCTIVLGTVPDAYYRAYGGTDVSCGHYRSNITIKVDLWRYDSGRWTMVATSGWRSAYNTAYSSAVTAPYSVPGCRYWDITTTVNVDGYQTYRDYGVDKGHYNRWNPTIGNC